MTISRSCFYMQYFRQGAEAAEWVYQAGYRSATYSCYLEQAIRAPENTTKHTSHVTAAHTFLIARRMRVRRALLLGGRPLCSLCGDRSVSRSAFSLREAPPAL
ncbi:hypothetical protein AOLI_G00288150 [Acnodon oligacanthus]